MKFVSIPLVVWRAPLLKRDVWESLGLAEVAEWSPSFAKMRKELSEYGYEF